MKKRKVNQEELGKWVLDISKYTLTAVLISVLMGKVNSLLWLIFIATATVLATLVFGLYLIGDEPKK